MIHDKLSTINDDESIDTLTRENVQAKEGKKEDNQILKMFPERIIKVSSFIDLLGSQL